MPGRSRDGQPKALASGLVHKLRNSLNALRTQVALLEKSTSSIANDTAARQIDKMEQAIEGMEGMLREFLAFADPGENSWEEVNLDSLIGEVLGFVGDHLEQAKITVVRQLAPKLPPVYGDHGRLKQALLNLVINAREAMPDGGQFVVRVQVPKRGTVVLEISDTGPGIPQQDRGRIFQPFFSTKPGGLGLGLAVAQRTVEELGGKISFESRLGKGTTFQLSLPAARRSRAGLERKAFRQHWLQTTP